MEPTSNLSLRIKYWRIARGMRAVDLARALEMSEASVSRWEAGTVDPPHATLQKIVDVLEVSLADFFADLPQSDDMDTLAPIAEDPDPTQGAE